jgi:hypothetical protein
MSHLLADKYIADDHDFLPEFCQNEARFRLASDVDLVNIVVPSLNPWQNILPGKFNLALILISFRVI